MRKRRAEPGRKKIGRRLKPRQRRFSRTRPITNQRLCVIYFRASTRFGIFSLRKSPSNLRSLERKRSKEDISLERKPISPIFSYVPSFDQFFTEILIQKYVGSSNPSRLQLGWASPKDCSRRQEAHGCLQGQGESNSFKTSILVYSSLTSSPETTSRPPPSTEPSTGTTIRALSRTRLSSLTSRFF